METIRRVLNAKSGTNYFEIVTREDGYRIVYKDKYKFRLVDDEALQYLDDDGWKDVDSEFKEKMRQYKIKAFYDTGIEKQAEDLYDSKRYSCGGYMCTVATTCYSPAEKRKICVDCLTSRLRRETSTEDEYGRYIVTDKGYCIDTEMFGFDTAGSLSQHNLRIDGNKVFETFWSYGGEYENDYNDEEFLGNIVFRTNTKIEILDKENYGQELK